MIGIKFFRIFSYVCDYYGFSLDKFSVIASNIIATTR